MSGGLERVWTKDVGGAWESHAVTRITPKQVFIRLVGTMREGRLDRLSLERDGHCEHAVGVCFTDAGKARVENLEVVT